MAMDPMMKSPAMPSPAAAAAGSPLSKLLENLKDKYPEDPDVLAAIELESGAMPEDGMESEDMGLPMPEESSEPAVPSNLEDMFAEDMAPEDEMESEMPPKKAKLRK